MQYKFERIGIHILAFLVGRCEMFGMYPFVVPFFMGAYLADRSSASLFAALLFGVMSTFAGEEVLRYGVVLLFLLILLKKTSREKIFKGDFQIAMASGAILCGVSMPYEYVVTGQDISLIYSFLEGVIGVCGTLVFEQGFTAMKVGTGRVFADNARFIGVFSIIVTALFGCPDIRYPIPVLFVVSGYLLLYNSYRFDGSIAVTTAGITGVVLAFRMEQISFLAVMIMVASLIVVLKGAGKPGVMMAYSAGSFLLGVLYEHDLLESNMLMGIIVVTLAFMVTPLKWLRQVVIKDEEITKPSQEILIQEATKRQIESFGEAFLAMEKMLAIHEQEWEEQIPTGLSNMYLSGDGISLLNAVESERGRLNDVRRNFIRQLRQVGEIIAGFQGEILEEAYPVDSFESRISEKLMRRGVVVSKAVCMKDRDGRLQVYIRCRVKAERIVTGRMLSKSVESVVARDMVCVNRGDDIVGKEESLFSFIEQGEYTLTTGVVRRNRTGEDMCGDNFSILKLDNGKAACMISDGMGSGENAYAKSKQVMDLLEQLLSAGFGRELAVELLNSFISFLTDGGGSSTLDLTMLDMYSGWASFIKLGASTTFIKHKEKVECIRSTTLPMGVLEEIEFDTCERKLYHGDIVVMVSDGVLDGIKNDYPRQNHSGMDGVSREDWLAGLIMDIDTENVQKLAQRIMDEVCSRQKDELRDDSTILAIGIWDR